MKPCPFCGKKIDPDDFVYGVHYNELSEKWIFNHFCQSNPLGVVLTVYGDTKEEVIERWNSRAEDKTSESV